jgi:hypothetical protein
VAGFFENDVIGSDLEYSGAVSAKYRLYVVNFEEFRGWDFVESNFLVNDFIVGVQERFEHVDSFLNLFDHAFHHRAVAIARDSEFVHAFDR